MTEVAYIPLKTADGAVLGHARVCGGTVVFQFRRAVQGQAVVLTDSGRFSGDLHGSVRMDGAVIAAAAIENGRVLCVGQTRGNALCADEVRRRLIDPAVEELRGKSAETAPLISNTGSNQDKSSPLSVVSVSSAPTEHASVPPQPARETIAQSAADEVQRTEAQSIPARGDMPRQAEPLRRANAPTEHAPVPPQPARETIAQSAADEVQRTEAQSIPARGDMPRQAEPLRRANAPTEHASVPTQPTQKTIAQSAADEVQRTEAQSMPTHGDTPRQAEPSRSANAPVEHASVPPQPAREPIAQPAADDVQRAKAQSIPAHGDTPRQAKPVRETAGKLLHFTRAEDRVPLSVQESAADSESFMALLRRADAAFSRLNTPVLPLVTQEGARSAAQSERARETHASADAFRTALSGTKAEPSPQKPSSAQRPPADTAECASHRRAWDEQVEALLELPNAIARERCDNPFPHIFPGAQFVRISGSGVLEHLEGEWISGRERYRLFAVRGEYSPLPPRHLSGFTRFIRTRSGGYWVRVTERGART
ncbi:MAG: hypothetical protein PUH73_03495 [Clostridium sp.]|nr:hypothetical protein [Clostridium sp.]